MRAFGKSHMANITLLNWPDRVANLPLTLDRFRATCVYFDVKFPPFLVGHIDAQKWISWGSLSALASIPEVFEREIGLLGFGDQWRSSTERLSIQTDPLLAILKELRNYETHLTFAGRRRHTEVDLRTVVSPMDHRSFFFSPISFCQCSPSTLGRLIPRTIWQAVEG